MKFKPANQTSPAAEREGSADLRSGVFRSAATRGTPGRRPALRGSQAGFTLAEVLAALVFMAIVIPVAVQGLQIASRAGIVSERKAQAARLAESKLNELIVTRQWSSSSSKGTIAEGRQTYPWRLEVQSWSEDGAMRLVTVYVTVPVQGQDYEVPVSTLVDASQ